MEGLNVSEPKIFKTEEVVAEAKVGVFSTPVHVIFLQ